MSHADGVLDQIDHALHDWGTSRDAMRWSPEAAPPPTPVPAFDPVAFSTAVNRFAAAYREAMRGFALKLNEWSPVLSRAFRLMQQMDTEGQIRRSAMRREYHRRQKRRSRS